MNVYFNNTNWSVVNIACNVTLFGDNICLSVYLVSNSSRSQL